MRTGELQPAYFSAWRETTRERGDEERTVAFWVLCLATLEELDGRKREKTYRSLDSKGSMGYH